MWEASNLQIAGLLRAAKAKGLAEAALARCGPQAQAIFAQPYSARWHPGPLLTEFSMALIACSSTAVFEELNYEMTRTSFGPIVKPLLQVVMAISGRSPATLLSRLEQSAAQGLKGVAITWTPSGPAGGRVTVVYPHGLPPEVQFAWRGVFRFVGELAGAPVTVRSVSVSAAGAFDFELGW
jgi:hypothetical protein